MRKAISTIIRGHAWPRGALRGATRDEEDAGITQGAPPLPAAKAKGKTALRPLACALALLLVGAVAQVPTASASSWNGWSILRVYDATCYNFPNPAGPPQWYMFTAARPAVTVYDGQLYAFFQSTAKPEICYSAFDATDGAWSALRTVGSPMPNCPPLAGWTFGPTATVYNDRLYLFAVDCNGAIYDDVYNGDSANPYWSGWQLIGNDTYVGIAATAFNGRLYLFEVDPQLHIEENVSSDGATWSGWSVIDSIALSAPAVTVYHNQLHLFAVGSDGALYDNISADGARWSGWQWIDSRTSYPPTVTVYNDQVHLFAVGTDGLIYENVSSGSGWSGWDSAPSQGFAAGNGFLLRVAPAVTTYNGQMALFTTNVILDMTTGG